MAILLRTGVPEKPEYLQIALENESMLKIAVMWTSVMTSVPQLMQRWFYGDVGPAMIEYYPQLQGFFNFFENFQTVEGDSVYSTAWIALPFPMKPNFDRAFLGCEGTNQIVLLRILSAFDRKWKMEHNLLIRQMPSAPQNTKAVDVQGVNLISNN